MAKKSETKSSPIKVVEGSGEMRKVTSLTPHPFAKQVFGKSPKHEVDELAADMEKNGQRDAIDILSDGRVLNGCTRLDVAIERGIKELRVIVHDLDEAGAKKFILEANLMRHHYDKLTVARVYKELKAFIQGDSGKARKTGEGDLRDRLAKRFKLAGRSLDRYVKMLDTPAAAHELYRKGVFSDGAMLALATLDPEQQKAVLVQVKSADEVQEKKLAATSEIAKYRNKNKVEREKAKPTGKTKDKGEEGPATDGATAGTDDPADAQGTEGTDDAVAASATDDNGQAESADDGAADDDEGVTVIVDEATEGDEDGATAATETDGAAEADPEAEDDDPVEVYHAILNELPDALDGLVDKIDDIAGLAMDPEAAVAALDYIASKIAILREAEGALAGVLA